MPNMPRAVATVTTEELSADESNTFSAADSCPAELYPGVPADTPWCVTLVFPELHCPERMVFVLHQQDRDIWVRDHGANFSLQLRSPCLNDVVEGVMAAESGYEHWGLLHRLQRVLEVLDNAEAAGGVPCVCIWTAVHNSPTILALCVWNTASMLPAHCDMASMYVFIYPAGAAGMAFMFTWLRLSSNKLLDWQRHFSYQPRDITWTQQQVNHVSLSAGTSNT